MRGLLALLLVVGCASNPPTPSRAPREVAPVARPATAPVVAASAAPTEDRVRWATPTGEIDVVLVGSGERGLVLLHGYGAAPEDLVPLAHELWNPELTIAVPTAPRAWAFGPEGRAWWERDAVDLDHQVAVARAEVEAVVSHLVADGHPSVIVLGFSQGASLSVDTALAAAEAGHPLRGVGVLSGRDFPRYAGRWSALSGSPVFLSHGRRDGVIPFTDGESMAASMGSAGANVTFVPFEGAHAIPPEVRSALAHWLDSL